MAQPPDRHILHVDMDAFFASIEQRDHPEWRGKPVVVGAGPHERGVVSTCSYEARKFGIHSAMPSREAGRRCPHAIFTPGNHALYAAVSQQVFAVFGRYTPFVEPVSVDEAFLDVSGSLRLFGPPETIAASIRGDLRRELGITGSVGIAHNMFLAKLASDMRKPDGQTVVPRDPADVRAFLAPLPVRRLWGVGKTTAELLQGAGLTTIGDIQRMPPDALSRWVGNSLANHLARLAVGHDERDLTFEWEEKSISRENTFGEDTRDSALLADTLRELADDVGRQVRQSGHFATVARLKLRWSDFRTITRQRPFVAPARDDFTFREMAESLFEAAYDGAAVRLIGFGVTGFTDVRSDQLLLFDDPTPLRDKRENVCSAVDSLRERLGSDAVRLGGIPAPDASKRRRG
jgi:nucleotidyltransferase/DNA polymerase involved in DNA repair